MSLTSLFIKSVGAVTIATQLAGCAPTQYNQKQGAAIGGVTGGLLGSGIAKLTKADSSTTRKLEAAGVVLGAAQGSAVTAKNVFCEESSSKNRTASRDNLTGQVTSDRTRQSQTERCDGGRRPVGRTPGPAPIF